LIRKIKNIDAEPVLNFLGREPGFNLFAIGDIEKYGCQGKNVEVWTDSVGGEIAGVLLRYHKSFLVYYSGKDADTTDFLDVIAKHPVEAEIISGKDWIIEKLAKKVDYKTYKKLYFCQLARQIDESELDTDGVIIASPEDAQGICDLQNTIDEFVSEVEKDHVEKNIREGFSRVYCIKNEDGEIVSMAQTSADTSSAAMIVGVCTHIDYRKRGYMRKIMTKLCYDLQQEGKLTCLFYDNKDAGRIYHSIGFETIGMWHMLSL